ncbi:hypothetical protein [Kitasatospora sp. NPDC088134]|uniref:hypothetical protein n=1 Tax=Kitasatospora sp. NPDC088134 TaxID=3364071 RepID=UPI003818269A
MNGSEESPTPARRGGRHPGCLIGCSVLVAAPVVLVAALLGTSASQSTDEAERARAAADARAARFGGLVAPLDYSRDVPALDVERAAAASGVEVLALTRGQDATVDLTVRVRVPAAAPPAPMAGMLTRCYRLREGATGSPPPGPRQIDCPPPG